MPDDFCQALKIAALLLTSTRISCILHHVIIVDGVAQWIERFPAEEEVGGSTPLTIATTKAGSNGTKALPALFYTLS